MRFQKACLVFLLLLAFVACQKSTTVQTPGVPSAGGVSDATLKKISAVIGTAGSSNKAFSGWVQAQNAAGVIPDGPAAQALAVCYKIDQAVIAAADTTLAYTQMTPAMRGSVLSVIQAVLVPIGDALRSGLFGLKDAALQKATEVFMGIQAGFNTAVAIIQGVQG